mmetsp:Transcript_73756/g.148623  ORF Transcript_73756/g.148623 Transcript_73756/m.148623 type:complete len:201 (-) Transcript_73756:377-979(-)
MHSSLASPLSRSTVSLPIWILTATGASTTPILLCSYETQTIDMLRTVCAASSRRTRCLLLSFVKCSKTTTRTGVNKSGLPILAPSFAARVVSSATMRLGDCSYASISRETGMCLLSASWHSSWRMSKQALLQIPRPTRWIIWRNLTWRIQVQVQDSRTRCSRPPRRPTWWKTWRSSKTWSLRKVGRLMRPSMGQSNCEKC